MENPFQVSWQSKVTKWTVWLSLTVLTARVSFGANSVGASLTFDRGDQRLVTSSPTRDGVRGETTPALAKHAVTNSTNRAKKTKPAKLKISGYGFLGDRQLKRLLRVLVSGGEKPQVYSADCVEDAGLILISALRREGYLEPALTAEMTLEDGRKFARKIDESMQSPLPRPLRARKVHFKIRKGV